MRKRRFRYLFDRILSSLFVFSFILIVAAIGYIIYDNKIASQRQNNPTTTDKSGNDSDQTTEVRKKELPLETEEVQKLIKMISSITNELEWGTYTLHYEYPNTPNPYFAMFYKNDRMLAKNLPDEIKMLLTIRSIYENKEGRSFNSCQYIVSEDKFIEKYHQLFGKNVSYQYTELTTFIPTLKVEEDIMVADVCGVEIKQNGTAIYNEATKAEQVGNAIYLYESIALAEEKSDNVMYYADVEKTKLIATGISKEEIFQNEAYSKQLTQYKYTFYQEDGGYYLYGVEKVK